MVRLEYYGEQFQDKENPRWVKAKRNLPPYSVSMMCFWWGSFFSCLGGRLPRVPCVFEPSFRPGSEFRLLDQGWIRSRRRSVALPEVLLLSHLCAGCGRRPWDGNCYDQWGCQIFHPTSCNAERCKKNPTTTKKTQILLNLFLFRMKINSV